MRHGGNLPITDQTGATGDYVFIMGDPPEPNDVFRGYGRGTPCEREQTLALMAKLARVMLNDKVADRLRAHPMVKDAQIDPEHILDNPNIPAGYTYLGQLIAHDMTFEPSPLSSDHHNNESLRNLRTSLLDLDCIYGGGPQTLPWLYRRDDRPKIGMPRTCLRLGCTRPEEEGDHHVARFEDLPRIKINSSDNNFAHGETIENDAPENAGTSNELERLFYEALIADPRNEDNLILSQITVLFCKLHNKIVSVINNSPKNLNNAYVFKISRLITLNIYHAIIVDDFLYRLLDPDTYWHYRRKEKTCSFKFLGPLVQQYGRVPIPVEFSMSAFRVGHAMVRENYDLDTRHGLCPPPQSRLETFTTIRDLLSFHGEPSAPYAQLKVPITDRWILEWSGLFWDQKAKPKKRIPSRRITPKVNYPLFRHADLEPPREHRPCAPSDSHPRHWGGLTYRDLARGFDSGLPNGQSLAREFGVEKLSAEDLKAGLKNRELSEPEVEMLAKDTPLFYYILRESEKMHAGERLGPLGSSIIAEVIFGALMVSSEHTEFEPGYLDKHIQIVFGGSKIPRSMTELIEFVA